MMGSMCNGELAGPSVDRRSAALTTLHSSGHRVDVCATTFGPGILGVQAYHTSVMVDYMEYAFSNEGVTTGPPLTSHKMLPNKTDVNYAGLTSISGNHMLAVVEPHFRKGTYDLLRKNCNSFSDCALFYLLGRRLDGKYRTMEQMGEYADEHLGLIRAVTMGDYVPNPKAATFTVDSIVERLRAARSSKLKKPAQCYCVGQPIEVYSATFQTWVGARVQTIHMDGEVTVVYAEQKCKKTVSAADIARIVRPVEGC